MISSFKAYAKASGGRPVIVHSSDLTTVRGCGKIRYEYRTRKSGSGPHANKADKRCRTRGTQLKKAIEYAD